MRLMMAWASGRRNRRGLGLPGCGRGVTVPISMKPKPSCPRPSMASPFLSRPAARPTGLANSRPMIFTGRAAGFLHSSPFSPRRPPAPSRSRDSSWAVSGDSRKSRSRARVYMGGLVAVLGGVEYTRSPAAFDPLRSAQPLELQQLSIGADLEPKGAVDALVGQERPQVMGRQADAATVATVGQNPVGAPLVVGQELFGRQMD